jgi:hypothetical protein
MLFRAGQFCYVSKTDQLQKKFLKKLHDAGGVMNHSEIMRSLHLSKAEMKEVSETLIESRQIERCLIGDGAKQTVVYKEL